MGATAATRSLSTAFATPDHGDRGPSPPRPHIERDDEPSRGLIRGPARGCACPRPPARLAKNTSWSSVAPGSASAALLGGLVFLAPSFPCRSGRRSRRSSACDRASARRAGSRQRLAGASFKNTGEGLAARGPRPRAQLLHGLVLGLDRQLRQRRGFARCSAGTAACSASSSSSSVSPCSLLTLRATGYELPPSIPSGMVIAGSARSAPCSCSCVSSTFPTTTS